MDLIFLDNGLISEGEHSYALLKNLCAAASRRGLRHRIFGTKRLAKTIAAELGAVPHFTRSLYESAPPGRLETAARKLRKRFVTGDLAISSPSERATSKLLNAAFRDDLDALPTDVWDKGNLLVVPAISLNQILGLVRCLLAKPEKQSPRMVCQLMFAPNWLPWGCPSRLGEKIYRKAFRLAAPILGRSLFFTVENEAMAALYREHFGIAARILPIPLGAKATPSPARARPTFGFFGYSKSDKGFHLLPGAIEICRRAGLDADFVVQIQHSGWEQKAVEADKALRALPNIRILDGVLSSEDYKSWTSRMDAILLPYDPVTFGMRGSGIFTESIAAGRPVIASAGTYAGESIAQGRAEGEVFMPYDSAALAGAMGRLLPRLEACRAKALERSDSFAKAHSPDAYLDILLAHAP